MKRPSSTLTFSVKWHPSNGDSIHVGGHTITLVTVVRDPAREVRIPRTRRGLVHAVAKHINRSVFNVNVKAIVIDGKKIGLERHK